MSVLDVIIAALPWPLKRLIYRGRGWEIGRGAKVGFSIIAVEHLVLGENARVGHANAFVRLTRLELGSRAAIGSFNRGLGPRELPQADGSDLAANWARSMTLGEATVVYNANFFDLAGKVELGAGTLISGGFSRFWTHETAEVDGAWVPTEGDITVGERCIVGAGAMLLPEAELPDGCVLGAGSVLTRRSRAVAGAVLFGNPARTVQAPDRAATAP